MMRFAVVVEKAASNYSAYVPDLPGCIATGKTVEETLREIVGAIEFHLEGMKLHGETIPQPSSIVDFVEVEVPELSSHHP
jgi:predicted RNase H-like HicB family nuclease